MVTNHFVLRTKERVGLKKNSANELFKKALKDGLRYKDCVSRPSLIKYLDNLIGKNNRSVLIYNRYIIITGDDEYVAITILDLPKEYYSTVKSLIKERSKNDT